MPFALAILNSTSGDVVVSNLAWEQAFADLIIDYQQHLVFGVMFPAAQAVIAGGVMRTTSLQSSGGHAFFKTDAVALLWRIVISPHPSYRSLLFAMVYPSA